MGVNEAWAQNEKKIAHSTSPKFYAVTGIQNELKVPDICIFRKTLIVLPKELFFVQNISCFIILFYHDKCSVRTGAHCYLVLLKTLQGKYPLL